MQVPVSSVRQAVEQEPVKVKGVDRMLTQEDIAIILQRPVRWVRQSLLGAGIIKSARIGHSFIVKRTVFEAWVDKGCPGFGKRV